MKKTFLEENVFICNTLFLKERKLYISKIDVLQKYAKNLIFIYTDNSKEKI